MIAYVAGHTHENKVTFFKGRHGHGFWQINTASHIDWPEQSREIEVMDNRDGTLSLFGTLLDTAAPVRAPRSGFSTAKLASLARTLAYNDPQRSSSSGNGGAAGRRRPRHARGPQRGAAAAGSAVDVPTGCQALLISTNGSIAVRPAGAVASRRATRLTVSAPSFATRSPSSGSPVASRIAVEVAVAGERLHELRAQAGEQVDDAGGHVGDAEHLAEVQRQQRPALRDDRDDDVARAQRRQDRADQAEHVRLVGREHADHAGRLGRREPEERPGDRVHRAEHRVQLVGPAGVVHGGVDARSRPRRARRARSRRAAAALAPASSSARDSSASAKR